MTKSIEEILSNFSPEGSSTFCDKVVTSFNDFQIQIKDIGDLRFPLKPRKVKSLINQARPARYGLKEKTLLDKSVRDVWEISKNRIKINQRLWKKSFDANLLKLKASLGLSEKSKLKAELHNLIIYEPGQFFKPHQDSEKCDDMVATLVVLLPSYYRGGTLVVDHQGIKKRFTSRSTPEDKLTFIAFYADCHHEVLPVTDGYRVALTYNLILKTGADVVSPHSDSELQKDLSFAINDYFEKEQLNEYRYQSSCRKIAYLLDHEYTPKGLHWSHLKNNDRARVNALREIANTLDMDIYLSLVEIHESWDCEDNTDRGYRRHRYWEYDEEVEIEEKPEDEYTVGELLYSETEFTHCMDIHGNKVDMSGLRIRESDTFHTKKMEDFTPFESEYEGYMGNWGNTMDRWYHRAAVVLWRKIDHYLMLLERSPVGFLKEVMCLAKKKAERENVQRIVTHILPSWQGLRNDDSPENFSRVLQLALVINSPEKATLLISTLGEKTLHEKTINAVIELADSYGAGWCIENMHGWLSRKYGAEEELSLIEPLLPVIKNLVTTASDNSLLLASWLLQHQLKAMKQSFDSDVKHFQQAVLDSRVSNRIGILIDLMLASVITKAFHIYDELVLYVIKNKNIFPVVEMAAVLLKVHRHSQKYPSTSKQYTRLKAAVLDEIKIALSNEPRSENDWSIKDVNRCNCDDCQIFNQFLQDSSKQKMVWPIAKNRRQHIHQIIESMKLPLTHKTERKGSPHKLHLTKTNQLFKRDTALRNKVKKALVLLETCDD